MMTTEEFKKDAIFQVTDRGYSVKEVSDRLGISTKSLYDWIKSYKKPESVRPLRRDGSSTKEPPIKGRLCLCHRGA
jgi:transposase-like protein